MGQMFRLTTLKDNTIASSLQYTNGQITLNGQKCRWKTLSACLNAGAFRTGRSGAASTIIALPGVATLHPVCAERRAASTLRYRASGYRLTPHMVLVVSNTLQYSFGGVAYFSRRRTGPDNRQVVEGVLRHISKRRQRHLQLEITIDTALATLSSGSQRSNHAPIAMVSL